MAYGTTENSPCSFTSGENDTFDQLVNTVGHVGPFTESKIINKDGDIVERGEIGEICTRGYLVFPGYLDDKEETDKVLGRDGWYKTGDLGLIREDGYLTITGRSKDMIIRGGENIYPAEIENVLLKNNNIIDAQVVSVPHKRLGEEVAVYIRLTR